MTRVDTGPIRQLYDHLGIEPLYVMPSLAAWQLQESSSQENLRPSLIDSVDNLRDLVVMSRDCLQIGVFEFNVGLEFLNGGRISEAVQCFEVAKRQWLFIDHVPLLSLVHLSTGMAYHAAGQFRQAAAEYFKVKQYLHVIETEPQRVEQFEAERSLQAFWNDLERWLMLAMASLRREFDEAQSKKLRSEPEPGDIETDYEDTFELTEEPHKDDVVANLTLYSVQAMSAADVNGLILKTAADIELLDEVFRSVVEGTSLPRPVLSGIHYVAEGEARLEFSGVRPQAVDFCRWLMTKIPAEKDRDDRAPASDEQGAPNQEAFDPSTTDDPQAWFRWQFQSGYLAELLKSVVQTVTGREPDDDEVERLMRAVGHLAELRVNYRLEVSQG